MKFGKRILDAAQWVPEHINYKKLKKTLKLSTSSNASFAVTEGTFVTALLSEIEKVNGFFTRMEAEFDRASRAFDDTHALTAAFHAVLDRCPSREQLTRERVFELMRDTRPHADIPNAEKLGAFFELCDSIDALRKFAFINYLAVVKILKKHDKHSALAMRESVTAFFEAQPVYASTRIAQIWTHTQCIASDLFATVPGFEPDALSYTCGICLDVLRLPVVLSCTHRFCNACLAQAADKYHQCPICKKEMDLNPANYPIDSVLARHVRSHFGAAAAESAFASEGDLPSVLEQKLRSALAAADGGADGDEGGAGPLADSTDTEVEEARDGPCAARAEPGRGGAGPSAGGLSAALEQPGAPGAPLLTSVPPPGPPGAPPLAHAEASERFGSPTVRLGSPTVSSLLWMDALSSLEATEARAAEEGVGYAAQLTPPPPPHTPSGAQRWPPASAEAEAEASHAAGAYLVAAAAARADGGGGSAALGPSGGAEDVLSFTLDGLLSGPSAAPPSAAATHTPTLGVGRTLKPGGQRKMACDKCHRAKAACEGYPCRRCERLNVPCVFPDKPRASKRARAEEAPAVEALSAGSAAGPIVLAAPCIAQPIGAHSRLAATPSEQPQPQPQRWERQQQPAVPAPSQAQLQPQLPPPPPAAQGHAQRAHPDSQPGSRHPQLLHSAALAPLPLHGGSMAALPASAAPPPAVGQGVRHALGSQPDVLDALSLALPQGEWRSKR